MIKTVQLHSVRRNRKLPTKLKDLRRLVSEKVARLGRCLGSLRCQDSPFHEDLWFEDDRLVGEILWVEGNPGNIREGSNIPKAIETSSAESQWHSTTPTERCTH